MMRHVRNGKTNDYRVLNGGQSIEENIRTLQIQELAKGRVDVVEKLRCIEPEARDLEFG
jgi:hypothetical protein